MWGLWSFWFIIRLGTTLTSSWRAFLRRAASFSPCSWPTWKIDDITLVWAKADLLPLSKWFQCMHGPSALVVFLGLHMNRVYLLYFCLICQFWTWWLHSWIFSSLCSLPQGSAGRCLTPARDASTEVCHWGYTDCLQLTPWNLPSFPGHLMIIAHW